jgi:hypothetical protein
MNKYITAFIIFNKAKPLLLIEPLYFSFRQSNTLLSEFFPVERLSFYRNKKNHFNSYHELPVVKFKLQNFNTQLFPTPSAFQGLYLITYSINPFDSYTVLNIHHF